MYSNASRFTATPLLIAAAVLFSATAATAADNSAFFDAALCKPAYTTKAASALYNEAEKVSKYQLVGAMAVYPLTEAVVKDGYSTKAFVLAGTTYGVLVEGNKADELAKTYQLTPEPKNPMIVATKSYIRVLADADQPSPEMGRVAITAREAQGIPGKTLLSCEFTSLADLEAMKAMAK
ncbi:MULTISPECIES: hypothetical protein [Erwiniaceae]|uniref:Uncharacterized protein n=1 Tax=Enterobacter agglomerans TaxID=549 RepID=A0ACC5RHL2_ENTAG|nr:MULTISPECIES: hypothetical protein [Erwiniaceae]MBK4724119.1 hypothetical protein [Pantoea agglomerans]MBP2154842.1 hypothetical protein [Erwinia rhapontici]MCS3605108.1 hypothetical protein [Erwinia rhapontici]NKG33041.1 hypothetical protein [Erwinia rhapontici]NNS08418.1 hypothetical protein [Erwinia sp. JH02]